ncbi:type II toxin-antitoxin system RelE/ParE family toxin [Paucihalobacter sp.]|uniref:type II toxin-antitoxin system RelE/ParE family toxin n=1 Tax=Paucihalobacter sp. TaxID=2850405 RepID=UPI003D16112C
MNYRFSQEAELELYKAECYYKLHQKEQDFIDDLAVQLHIIQTMPYAFQIRYRNIRIVNFDYFDYSIHFAIHDGTIFILRILNQKQDF